MTANSRAPEVNLFNKPRITLWPLQVDPDPSSGASTRNAKDKLIAFCSTVGGVPYYFQRYNTYTSDTQSPIPSSQSPLMDFYLSSNTANPPGTPSRNQALYAYLQNLTNLPIPGLGGSLSGNGGKYSAAVRDQILTEMFDYVRSSINTFSSGMTPYYYYTPFNPSGFVTGQSQVVPTVLPADSTRPYATKGFGRFSTITEAALIFYRQDPVASNVGAVLILEPFNPTPGPEPWSGNVRYVITGLNNLTLTGAGVTVATPFQSPATNLVDGPGDYVNTTAQTGLEQYLQYKSGTSAIPKTLGTADPEKNYPFYASFTLPSTATSMNFTGGSITIQVYPGVGPMNATTLVQTLTMTFPPNSSLPIPTSLPSQASFTDYDVRLSQGGISLGGQHNPLPLVILDYAPSPTNGDTVRSVEARYGGNAHGDYRLFDGATSVPASYFEGHGLTDPAKGNSPHLYADTALASRAVHSLTIGTPNPSTDDTSSSNGYYQGAGMPRNNVPTTDPRGVLLPGGNYADSGYGIKDRKRAVPVVPRGLQGAYLSDGITLGDWDTGIGLQPDGPYINPADQCTDNTILNGTPLYYTTGGNVQNSFIVEGGSGSSFSPNRQISSAVAFGSLPTGIDPSNYANSKPWQTLLFCKNPLGGATHPGFGVSTNAAIGGPPYQVPSDNAFLDFFTMPIVEPYAISEPFSSAGKVNMNYQIVPFTYLTRSTAVHAVLKATNMMALPTSATATYKFTSNPALGDSVGQLIVNAPVPDYRYTINPDEKTGTLAGFEQRFGNGDIFRSASEICDIYLVPQYLANTKTAAPNSPSYTTMDHWWKQYYQLTGDNLRELPYNDIYPRLTTKSNTFTVHVRAEALKKVLGTAVNQFVEDKDQVTGEFRGSFIVQRYLDPNSDSLVLADGKTPGTELDPNSMVGPYKFRIVSSKRFAP